jgi:hypothetical protein
VQLRPIQMSQRASMPLLILSAPVHQCQHPNGVFVSNDIGATWTITSVVPGTQSWETGELVNAKLSVSADGSNVWSALIRDVNAKARPDSISFSDNQGATWIKMDAVSIPNQAGGLNPGGQASLHFSLLASPTNRNEVFAGGDSHMLPFPNFIGAQSFTGVLFRGDAIVTATGGTPSPQWEHMTHSNSVAAIPGGGTISNSGPHPDQRDMEFRADGSILEADDGGITIRTNPSDSTGDWFSICGNMQVFEVHSVAYEPLFKSVAFGTQDNGSIFGTLGQSGTFFELFGGDGNACMIDYDSDPDVIYFFVGPQFYSPFARFEFSKATRAFIPNSGIALELGGTGNFVTVVAMNPANRRELAVAVRDRTNNSNRFVAFSSNHGISFTQVRTPESAGG